MPKAFVLMNAELGSEESIVSDLKKFEDKEIYLIYVLIPKVKCQF